MNRKWITGIVLTFALSAALGFATSQRIPIQPGYFEKQEAPAYGVATDKAIGSEFGKEFEEHYRNLYREE